MIARVKQEFQTDNTNITHIGVKFPQGSSIHASIKSSRYTIPLIIAIKINKFN